MGVASQFFDIPMPMPPLREPPVIGDPYLRGVVLVGDGRLDLRWDDVPDEDLYEVYRGELAGPFSYRHDTPMACGLPAGTTRWVTGADQMTDQPSYYYLVVPRRGYLHGWGAASAAPRPPSASPCP
jgi:hypothetical protein